MLFLKVLVLSSILEIGYIPRHDLSLYSLDTYKQAVLSIDQTIYVDYSVELKITKYGFISGGMTSYSFPVKNSISQYPFRMDYFFGAGVRYSFLELGWNHGCYHPIAPNVSQLPLPLINTAQDRFYIRAKIGDKEAP